FVHNGALAGLVAVCSGSDVYHPLAAAVVGGVAGVLFVQGFTWTQERLKIDDVLGVWPLHGLCGAWGGIATGLFGAEALGGMGGVSLVAQVVGTLAGVAVALGSGFAVYTLLAKTVGIRLNEEQEYQGSDLAIHRIHAYPEDAIR
ncbi:MAG: ammonium transporter, partial [Nitrospinae bacterium]|nr:ammonium transporter [Nitrospinota bacterium]